MIKRFIERAAVCLLLAMIAAQGILVNWVLISESMEKLKEGAEIARFLKVE